MNILLISYSEILTIYLLVYKWIFIHYFINIKLPNETIKH